MTINEYTYMIVKNLITEYPVMYKNMKNTDHNEASMLSEWHLEGSVWTHTMMVTAAMQQYAKGCPNYKELLIAALLHDIGKPFTREINNEKQKVTYYGHPGMSTFLAVNLLNKIDPTLTHQQKVYTLLLINYHQVLFNLTDDMSEKAFNKLVSKFDNEEGCFLLNDIIKLRNADSVGRISTSSGKLSGEKFQKLEDTITFNYLNTIPTEEVTDHPEAILLVGLPGSGKSTYAQQFFPAHTLISRDAQVEKLGNGLSYNEAFHTVDQKEVDNMYENLLGQTLQKKENLVIDKTNLTHKGRMRVINKLHDKGYNIKLIVLLPPMLTIYERNQQRKGKTIPEKIIRQMMTTFEMPFQNEGEVEYVFDF